MDNPSLKEQPRHEPANTLPVSGSASILDWLETTGRLIAREEQVQETKAREDEEFTSLMTGDDGNYEDDENDDFELDD
jgi:hypothetical protein